ncbi:MAG: Rrf2 family transcriptional regulator [Candidatus Margulisiibacteriota bacterium]
MKLSTKSRYAVTALFDLATNANGAPIQAKVISKRQGISLNYLEQLLLKLRKAGIIKTVRGPAGGHYLAKEPAKISVGSVIRATDGPIKLASCVSSRVHCTGGGCCSTRKLWHNLSEKVALLFDQTTLADLCQKEQK